MSSDFIFKFFNENERKYNYNQNEMALMVVITALTNFVALPTLVILYRKRMIYQFYIGSFTVFVSFMYHLMDSISCQRLFLDDLQWHKLDNIGSILSLIMLVLFYLDLQDNYAELSLNFSSLFLVMILQEKDPWNITYTITPIFLYIILAVVIIVKRRRLPVLNYKMFFQGTAIMSFGIFFFVMGLDDQNDYLRIYHGIWHSLVAGASFYNWQSKILQKEELFTLTTIFSKKIYNNQYAMVDMKVFDKL